MLTVTLCAMAIAGAVEMILELEQPFHGLVRLSHLPMPSTSSGPPILAHSSWRPIRTGARSDTRSPRRRSPISCAGKASRREHGPWPTEATGERSASIRSGRR